jgi:hypothetical protein
MTTVRFRVGEIKLNEAFRTGMLVFGEPAFEVEPASALRRVRTEAGNPVEQALDPKTNGRRYGFPITLLYHAMA